MLLVLRWVASTAAAFATDLNMMDQSIIDSRHGWTARFADAGHVLPIPELQVIVHDSYAKSCLRAVVKHNAYVHVLEM